MFDDYKFHCSSLGKIMTGSRTKDPLGETCKTHLLECWINTTYGRYQSQENKYIEKGNLAEEDSITLYSRIRKKLFVKNTQVFENEFIIGIPDIVVDNEIIDTKTCWSIFTFYSVLSKPVNNDYKFQINGYRELTGSTKGTLVYTLVNTPDVIVEQEKSKLRYRMGLIDTEASEVYQQACKDIDKNHIFDDIPITERYIEFDIQPLDMRDVYEKIKACRVFLNDLSDARLNK